MSSRLKTLLKDWTPPIVMRSLKRRWGTGIRFSGRPGTWEQACAQSSGYSSTEIVDRVAAATREVVAGRAVYERDSVTFHAPDFQYPLLSVLLRYAALHSGDLSVVDFGGSLGSTYRQCQPFLRGLRRVRWHVVEQEKFVEAGAREFATAELSFYRSLTDIGSFDAAPVLLLASVLQYLEKPADWWKQFLDSAPRFIVIDRTPFSDLDFDRLCIQHVPSEIYPASYPCWILSYPNLLASLPANWRLLGEFPTQEGAFTTDDGFDFSFRGLILERSE